jgi:hypothetical protein
MWAADGELFINADALGNEHSMIQALSFAKHGLQQQYHSDLPSISISRTLNRRTIEVAGEATIVDIDDLLRLPPTVRRHCAGLGKPLRIPKAGILITHLSAAHAFLT